MTDGMKIIWAAIYASKLDELNFAGGGRLSNSEEAARFAHRKVSAIIDEIEQWKTDRIGSMGRHGPLSCSEGRSWNWP